MNPKSSALASKIEALIKEEKEASYKEGLQKGIDVLEKVATWLRPTNQTNKYANKVAAWVEKELEALR